MKRVPGVLVLLIVVFSFNSAHAQLKGFSIGPFAEVGWPTGDFQTTNKTGIGAGLTADIKLPGGKLGITGSASYMQFDGKRIYVTETPENYPAIKAFPIRAGLKYRFLPLLYLKLEGGAANFTNGNGSAFIASPGIGLRVLGIDIQGKYEAWMKSGTTYAFWGVRAGINF